MKFFVDTAEVDTITELNELGLIDGVTTNPSLIRQSGGQMKEVIQEICAIVEGPVSAEVISTDYEGMMREAEVLGALAPNVCIKLPLTIEGLKACRSLTAAGKKTNVTLCFSANQALLAAKAGATYISPFIGRLDDINIDGTQLIADIRKIYDNYSSLKTEILAASIRSPNHVSDVAMMGADVATMPAPVIKKLFNHPLTDRGLEQFLADWAASGQKII